MKMYNVNSHNNQNFKAIQLTPKEKKLAESIIKNVSGKGNVASLKQDTNLFNIFYNHLENEAKLKSGKCYMYNEVIAELSLLFSEILSEIKENGGVLQTIISKLNEYKPSKNAKKPEYLNTSLDEDVFPDDKKTQKKVDLITEADLPVPESAEVRERNRNTLNGLIESANISPLAQIRIEKLMNGKYMTEIAREENVSTMAVFISKKRANLQIQRKNGILPQSIYDKAKSIKKLLGLSSSENCIADSLIKHLTINYLSNDTIKKRFDDTLSLFKCDKKVLENIVIDFLSILGLKTETLKKNIQNIAKLFDITEEQAIGLGLKTPFIFTTTTDKLEKNMQQIASVMNLSYDEVRTEVLKEPKTIFYTTEGISKRKNVRLYYNLLTNNPNKDFSLRTLCMTNFSHWYNNALTYIFTGEPLLKNNSGKYDKLISYIKSLDKDSVYTFNIPGGEAVSGLINYAEQLSIELLGENVFKFNIVSDFETQKKQLAESLNISVEKASKITDKYPFILYNPIQNTIEKLKNFANKLNITEEKALNVALKDKNVLILSTDMIFDNIMNAAQKMGGANPELIEIFLNNPRLYSSRLDEFIKKKALKEYYLKLTNKTHNKIHLYSIAEI